MQLPDARLQPGDVPAEAGGAGAVSITVSLWCADVDSSGAPGAVLSPAIRLRDHGRGSGAAGRGIQ